MSVHDGHRARRKEQFRAHGLDSFADHEALELLLFYASPKADMNPVAHRLLERFGSLDAVLSASERELTEIPGVGKHTATLLTLILPLVRRARLEAQDAPALISPETAGAFFGDVFFGMRDERLYEACLDAKGKLLRCCTVGEGSVDVIGLNVRRLVENALNCGDCGVVLAHNHPSGVALPSEEDNAATLLAQDALRAVGIRLLDHIIVADGDFVSLRQNGLLAG